MKRFKFGLLILLAMLACACVTVTACAGPEHKLVKVEAAQATCEAAGNIAYYRCTDDGCGKYFSDADGKEEISLSDTVIAPLGHTGGTADCQNRAVCTRCNTPYGDLAAHDYAAEWVITETGHSHTCKVCGVSDGEIAHRSTAIGTAVEATCTENGTTAGEKCSICGYVIAQQETLSALGHTPTYYQAKEATCEEDGYAAHWHCNECGKDFSDEACKTEVTVATLPATGHEYSQNWIAGENGQHYKECLHDGTHRLTENCKWGTESLAFTDATGHYYTCEICGAAGEKKAHTLENQSDDSHHWQACRFCDYLSDKNAHVAASIAAVVIADDLKEGQSMTAAHVSVTATCDCGKIFTVSEGVTVEDNVLVSGENTLTVSYNGLTCTVTADVSEAEKFLLTLSGATLADGVTTTVYLKEGAKLPEVKAESGKTLLGFKDGDLNVYTAENFAMPSNPLTINALYAEDMPLFAPSDTDMEGTKTGEHVLLSDGVMATRFSFTPNERKALRPTQDSGTAEVNVYAPAIGRSLMFLYLVNESDVDTELLYQVENYYKFHGEMTITVKAGERVAVPFIYGDSEAYGSFAGCDHYITLQSGSAATVSVYARLCCDGATAITKITANLLKTMYIDGDTIDLSDLMVTATVGSSYNIKLVNFSVDIADGTPWEAKIEQITVSFGRLTSVIKLNNLDDWIVTTFSKHLSGGTTWLEAEYVDVEGTNFTATRYTFKAGATKDSDTATWPNNDGNNPNVDGYNVRIPTYSGIARTLRLYLTNNGAESISFRLYAENYGDKGGWDFTLQGGESRIYTVTVTPGASIGCNYNIKLLQDVATDTAVTIYGYFKTYDDEIQGIGINAATTCKTTFRVGERFSAKNLTVDVTQHKGQSGDVNIANFTTDYDGHVFTAEDIGTKTVTVSWNGLTTTYEITVTA